MRDDSKTVWDFERQACHGRNVYRLNNDAESFDGLRARPEFIEGTNGIELQMFNEIR